MLNDEMLITPKHPLLLLSAEFSELCKPLLLFHIHHVTYLKQFNNGARIMLSNKPQWVKDYYDLALFDSSLFEKKPSDYESGFNVWLGDYDLPVYQHGRRYYNTADCITITEPQHDSCEHYLFSVAPEHSKTIQYLVNHIDILYHFISFVRDRGELLLKKSEKSKIILNDIDGDHYFKMQNSQGKFEESRKLFYNQTRLRRYYYDVDGRYKIKFTERELTCISYLLNNKTAEETSTLMNISRRTVESYLDNIKDKLNCKNKVVLIEQLKKDKFLLFLRYQDSSKPYLF